MAALVGTLTVLPVARSGPEHRGIRMALSRGGRVWRQWISQRKKQSPSPLSATAAPVQIGGRFGNSQGIRGAGSERRSSFISKLCQRSQTDAARRTGCHDVVTT